jgi:glycosyltransferase involved in cell wall biosynthesis
MLRVHIVLSDRGWILERLAREIASRYEYVTYSTEINPTVPIQYYMTYGTWKGRVSPFEISFFTHLEPTGKARDRFFHVAAHTDYCVCMSQLYEDLLRQQNISHVTTISPGVDLDRFVPKVKIAVVGRTYHTGRKGENLVADVLDIPDIEWHFTGDGWPLPGLHLPDEKMPEFYRSMDYILVPSLYEGGPMCVLEALACGKEVIAPPVGWVSQYPHIQFETGNSQDLRRVLQEVVERRFELRKSVTERTWDNWAAGHDVVFRECYEQLNRATEVSLVQSSYISISNTLTQAKVALVMHGDENKSKGGPSVRVPKTSDYLRMQGIQAKSISYPASDISEYDLIHAFNVWPPETALDLLKTTKDYKKKLVLSSIFLDLSEAQNCSSEIIKIFEQTTNRQEIEHQLAKLRQTNGISSHQYQNPKELRPGYFAKVRRMVSLADHTILLSEKERELLSSIGAVPQASSIVHNPVDVSMFRNADTTLFAEQYNVRDYVLCVGRIEPRKNQLMLVHALRDLNIPIVLIGHLGGKYLELIKQIAGNNLKIIDRLPPNSDILASAYAGARVFVLPSWSEGASLAALEAAAAGINLVLSNRSSEQEYFKNHAQYCDPGDSESIRLAVESAYQNPPNKEQRQEQQLYVEKEFSWQTYTQKTLEVYQKVINSNQSQTISSNCNLQTSKLSEFDTIYVDLTTSANYTGRWSGIARLEFMLAKSLFDLVPYDVKFIVWNSPSGYYFEVPPPEKITLEQLTTVARNPIESFPDFIHKPNFDKNSVVFMMGSSWMQNQGYVYSLLHTCKCNQLKLAFVSADIIPVKFPEWMPPDIIQSFYLI